MKTKWVMAIMTIITYGLAVILMQGCKHEGRTKDKTEHIVISQKNTANDSQKNSISSSKNNIHQIEKELEGVSLGDTTEKVIMILGKPKQMTSDLEQISLIYDGIMVTTKENVVIQVFVDGEEKKTNAGLEIQNSELNDVIALYGMWDKQTQEENSAIGFSDLHYYRGKQEFGIRVSS